MKKIYAFLLALILAGSLMAQAPLSFNYQAVVRDASGNIIADTQVGMRISILHGSVTDTAVCQEEFAPTTNAFGLVTLAIGSINPVDFSAIDWSAGPYFVKAELDPAGGTSYVEMGTSQLISVPYALYAGTTKTDFDVDDLMQRMQDLEDIVFTQLPIPENGLVAYYPFDGNANDESGNNNHGTVLGATLTMDRLGNIDNAYSFDGVNDYIDLGNSAIINSTIDSSFSISIWYKTNTTIELRIFSKRNVGYQGFEIIPFGNEIGLFIGDGSTYHWGPITVFNQNAWNHYVCVIDKSQKKIFSYLNGILADNVMDIDDITGIISNSESARIGINVQMQGPFLGKLDDIRIYNRTLANTEIKQLYHEGGYTSPELVIDVDGNSYNTVTIGTQVWMAENLKTTKYNDGTAIPLVTDSTAWSNLTTPGYCWYNNDSATHAQTYGALYNWYTVETGKLCPTGLHVPTDDEWKILTTYLGGDEVAGGKLKETGTAHWNSPNTDATNETGFTALPGGSHAIIGTFSGIGYEGYWWSATEYFAGYAWYRCMFYDSRYVHRDFHRLWGFSVRCLRD